MRDKKDLIGLNRSSLGNQLLALKDSVVKAPPAYNMDGLIAENKWTWLTKNLCSIWKARYVPYPFYSDHATNSGIFTIVKQPGEAVTVALISDWASDTPESQLIAQQCGTNDYSVHLGDTYYVGNDNEIAENFNTDQGGTWPYGTLGSFALMGNHEMYSSGQSFFTQLLPYMGAYQGDRDTPIQVQQAGFFCLENDYWRVIGLDTGYDSLCGFLGLSPNQNLDLTPEQKDWLTNTVQLNNDNRGIIILTHHQLFSAFEPEFPNPMNYISSIITPGRDVIWFFGHEHRFSVYGPNEMANGAKVFGRCIGHGGMPVELDKDGGIVAPNDPNNVANPVNRNLVIYDQRQREVIENNIPLGHNGYVILTLNDANLLISYFDDNGGTGDGRKILEESWTIDNFTGTLTGNSITDYTINGDQPANTQLSLFGNYLTDAIG